MKTTLITLFMSVTVMSCLAQERSSTSVDGSGDAYKLINLQYPSGLLREFTTWAGDIAVSDALSYEWLNENNRGPIPGGALEITPFVDFDTLLTKMQKSELGDKFKNLRQVTLQKDKIDAQLISQAAIENRAAEPQFCYGIVSFPIIQEGKDGILYGIIYEMSGICTVSHPGSNMHVYRKVEDKWEYFCIVNVSV
jgi:hypothetical protein